jgi:hypothetical protein
MTINEILLFCLRILKDYSIFDVATINYSTKLQDRDRDFQKALTQFSPK